MTENQPTNPYAAPSIGKVDRAALLKRHSPTFTAGSWADVDARSPLQVGNGNFAFTADITGLQTNPDLYAVRDDAGNAIGTLLGTMSSWGWHSIPFDHLPGVAPGTPAPPIEVALREYQTPVGLDGKTRSVPYVDLKQEQWGGVTGEPDIREEWLRNNPHRLDLGRIGFWIEQPELEPVAPEGEPVETVAVPQVPDISNATQHLDLATGILHSQFSVGDSTFAITTAVNPYAFEDPKCDQMAIQIERLAGSAQFGIEFKFPYGSQEWGNSQDWTKPAAHSSTLSGPDKESWGDKSADVWRIDRTLDSTAYSIGIFVISGSSVTEVGDHHYRIAGDGNTLEVTIYYLRDAKSRIPWGSDCAEVFKDTADSWERFWNRSAAVSFDGTPDPRAAELERRIVLSQYLIAINSAGDTPPAETGLMLNSWRGKFHLEMHYWHAANLPLWGHPELLERSLAWYSSIQDVARATATRQGYEGARWPKQTDPSGTETPSSIGTFLIWQQPHPIFLAELIYRAESSNDSQRRRILQQYTSIIKDTADFMASFAVLQNDGKYHLREPLVPAQESYARNRQSTSDPTFELAYWAFALKTAANWFDRLASFEEAHNDVSKPTASLNEIAKWREIAASMWQPEPTPASNAMSNGAHASTYPAIAVEPYTIRTDHPSMLAALGVVPDVGMIDPEIMTRTLADITDGGWEWESTWGWDYPMGAMTATRLGMPDEAITWLMLDKGKNEFLANGHNYQTPALPIYLPGNGGLLNAIGLMAGGWDNGPEPLPTRFPKDWKVQSEGFIRNP